MDLQPLIDEAASPSVGQLSAMPSSSLLSSRFLPPPIPAQSINPAQLHRSTLGATNSVVENTLPRRVQPSAVRDSSSDTQMSNYGSMAVIEAFHKANLFHVRLHYRDPFIDGKINPKLKIYLDDTPLKTVTIHSPDGSIELRGAMPFDLSLSGSIKASVQAMVENEDDIFDSVELGMYRASDLKRGQSRSASPVLSRGKRPYESDEEYVPSKRTQSSKASSSKKRASSSTTSRVFAKGEPVTVYRGANGEIPSQTRVTLNIEGDLNTMATGWSMEEFSNRRRLVKLSRHQEDSVLSLKFSPLATDRYDETMTVVSCILNDATDECYITSVDIIFLLEALIASKFSVEEKNRIRRNLEGFKPVTVSKSRVSDPFFALIMSYPPPRPRNIEKDVKVFPWRLLPQALQKIVGKYSYAPGNNTIVEDNFGPRLTTALAQPQSASCRDPNWRSSVLSRSSASSSTSPSSSSSAAASPVSALQNSRLLPPISQILKDNAPEFTQTYFHYSSAPGSSIGDMNAPRNLEHTPGAVIDREASPDDSSVASRHSSKSMGQFVGTGARSSSSSESTSSIGDHGYFAGREPGPGFSGIVGHSNGAMGSNAVGKKLNYNSLGFGVPPVEQRFGRHGLAAPLPFLVTQHMGFFGTDAPSFGGLVGLGIGCVNNGDSSSSTSSPTTFSFMGDVAASRSPSDGIREDIGSSMRLLVRDVLATAPDSLTCDAEVGFGVGCGSIDPTLGLGLDLGLGPCPNAHDSSGTRVSDGLGLSSSDGVIGSSCGVSSAGASVLIPTIFAPAPQMPISLKTLGACFGLSEDDSRPLP